MLLFFPFPARSLGHLWLRWRHSLTHSLRPGSDRRPFSRELFGWPVWHVRCLEDLFFLLLAREHVAASQFSRTRVESPPPKKKSLGRWTQYFTINSAINCMLPWWPMHKLHSIPADGTPAWGGNRTLVKEAGARLNSNRTSVTQHALHQLSYVRTRRGTLGVEHDEETEN